MKAKKLLYSSLIMFCAFCLYNEFGFVKAETDVITEENTVENSTLSPDDIQPAIINNLKLEEPKEEVKAEEQIQKEANAIDEDKTTDTQVTDIKSNNENNEELNQNNTQEAEVKKEELPVLDDIQLPEIEKKSVNNEPVKIEVSSQRIPAGTVIPLKLATAVNSVSSSMGDQFNAILTSDIIINDNVVLPAGSVIRGTLGTTQKAGFFAKEAKVMLMFDHIVTPAGKQIQLSAYLTGIANLNYEGYITGGTSYAKAFKADVQRTKDIIVDTTNFGVEKGLSCCKGVPVVLTAPLCAIGGTLGGGGYLVGKSVYNMFKKGAEVFLQPGIELKISLLQPVDIPIN